MSAKRKVFKNDQELSLECPSCHEPAETSCFDLLDVKGGSFLLTKIDEGCVFAYHFEDILDEVTCKCGQCQYAGALEQFLFRKR